jgi:hypothetical protein
MFSIMLVVSGDGSPVSPDTNIIYREGQHVGPTEPASALAVVIKGLAPWGLAMFLRMSCFGCVIS